MGEPGGLPSTGSHRVRHDWSNLAAAAAAASQYLSNIIFNIKWKTPFLILIKYLGITITKYGFMYGRLVGKVKI